uniref:Variant surface glycoprotein 1125.1754 n=1 Tax=Trypanosoma brucei TaxID=5691 RepID=A0A1J0R7N2_9TRYP|nr:variant surface glycoprotein 1125.1754 [Trypanosoma brucei]
MHTLWPVALLTGYFLAIAAANNGNKIAHDSTQWCHDIKYLEAALTAMDKEMNKRQNQLQADAELITKWKLAEAAADQWEEQRKYTALSIIITAIAQQNAAAAEAYRTAAAEVKKAIRRRLDALQLAARSTSALKQKVQGNPTAGGGGAQCIATTAYEAEEETSCPDPGGSQLKTDEVEHKLHTATHIKLTNVDAINELVTAPKLTIAVTGGGKTPFSNPGNTPGTCNTAMGQDITGNTNHITYTITAATHAATKTPSEHPIDTNSDKPNEPTTKKNSLSAWLDIKFVTHGLKNLKVAYNKKQINLNQATHSTLTTLPGFRTVIANLFSAGDPPADQQNTDYSRKITDIIKETYGPEDGDFKRKFVTELANQDVKYTKAGNEQEKKLGALSKDADLSIALSFMINKRHEFQLQKETKPVSTVPKQNCQGKTKDKCKDDCEWKGTDDKGECKPKEGEDAIKAANDAKTTNTTGSNSFVINQTPLWLAFFVSMINFLKFFAQF